eukprot:1792051-Heterocapsa_arctica.AAC.1
MPFSHQVKPSQPFSLLTLSSSLLASLSYVPFGAVPTFLTPPTDLVAFTSAVSPTTSLIEKVSLA